MNLDAERLAKELRRLCQRGGARSPQRWRPLDPQIARICRITERDRPEQRAQKLADAVRRFLEHHPEEREVLLTALALDPLARADSLHLRLRWLAGRRFHGGDRTMSRRLDDAIEVFVEVAIAEQRAAAAAGDVGYEIEDFDATVAIDGDIVKIIERRKIKSTRDQLDLVRCCRGVRQAPSEEDWNAFHVDVVSGGQVRDVNRQAEAVEVWIDLPKPLDTNQLHEFEVSYEFPKCLLRGPYYAVQPATPFGTVSMAIRFDPRCVPVRVRRIVGVMPPQLASPSAGGDELPLDPSARVRATFRDVHPGRAYGIRWD